MLQQGMGTAKIRPVGRETTDEDRKFAAELFNTYHDTLMRYLRRRLGDLDDAADMAQEVFFRISRIPGIANVEYPRAYMFRTARNLLENERRYRYRRHASDHVDFENLDLASEVPAQDVVLQAKQELTVAIQAIRNLSPKCQAVFAMHRFKGMSYRQIADELGLSVSMVEKYIIQALAAVRWELKQARDLGERDIAEEVAE